MSASPLTALPRGAKVTVWGTPSGATAPAPVAVLVVWEDSGPRTVRTRDADGERYSWLVSNGAPYTTAPYGWREIRPYVEGDEERIRLHAVIREQVAKAGNHARAFGAMRANASRYRADAEAADKQAEAELAAETAARTEAEEARAALALLDRKAGAP